MVDRTPSDARILIVDDEPDNVELVQRILEADGYKHFRTTNDPRDVEGLVDEFEPDLILLDIVMPHMMGYDVLHRLGEPDLRDPSRPVLVLTSDHSRQAQRDAWEAGAKDFITKPLSPSEVRMRVRNLIETRLLHLELKDYSAELEDRVRRRTSDLEEARLQIMHRLARAAEYRDDDTGQHTRRVGRSAARIAQALGWPLDQVSAIGMAAPLHDVGKIGIPDSILLNTGPLSDEDFEVMKGHCLIGADLLSSEDVPLLRLAAEIAMSHHERWDGGGYPNGLAGEDIPLSGRIVAVADTFDALTHARPYKEAWPVKDALNEIASLSGAAYDPQVVELFEDLVRTQEARACSA
ncbi:MAG: response regulator [Longimicrobiales bacterium]|nr:response regulator [Longimicrobiales bacterium]